MTKRLVEIDDADLEAARAALATSTVEETVALALREVAAAAARRREVERMADGSSALMARDGERARAWRRPCCPEVLTGSGAEVGVRPGRGRDGL